MTDAVEQATQKIMRVVYVVKGGSTIDVYTVEQANDRPARPSPPARRDEHSTGEPDAIDR